MPALSGLRPAPAACARSPAADGAAAAWFAATDAAPQDGDAAPRNLTVSLMSEDYQTAYANLSLYGASPSWQKFEGQLVASDSGAPRAGRSGWQLLALGEGCGWRAGWRPATPARPACLLAAPAGARAWLGLAVGPVLGPPAVQRVPRPCLLPPLPRPTARLVPRTDSNARLVILFDGPGSIQLDYVSLFPQARCAPGPEARRESGGRWMRMRRWPRRSVRTPLAGPAAALPSTPGSPTPLASSNPTSNCPTPALTEHRRTWTGGRAVYAHIHGNRQPVFLMKRPD